MGAGIGKAAYRPAVAIDHHLAAGFAEIGRIAPRRPVGNILEGPQPDGCSGPLFFALWRDGCLLRIGPEKECVSSYMHLT